MNYQFYVCPTSENYLTNYPTIHKEDGIKQISFMPPKKVYAKYFTAAVKKYNNFLSRGQSIGDYYESIKSSNIPEIYLINIVVNYDTTSQEDMRQIQKSFSAFKDSLEKEPQTAIVAAYLLTNHDSKELSVFFVPIVSNFQIGLDTRNDIIEIANRINNVPESNLNIIKAMPIVSSWLEDMWRNVTEGKILSQREYEEETQLSSEMNPKVIHSLAIENFASDLSNLERTTYEIQAESARVQNNLTRIREELVWRKKTAEDITSLEERREMLGEEVEARPVAEKYYSEEHYRERKIAAEMAEDELSDEPLKRPIQSTSVEKLISDHISWQSDKDIQSMDDVGRYSQDTKRLNAKNIAFDSYTFSADLIGASFYNCTFANCVISGSLKYCSFINCTLINTTVDGAKFTSCDIKEVKSSKINIIKGDIVECVVKNSDFSYVLFKWLQSDAAMCFTDTNFNGAEFENCTMANNMFARCDFTGVKFKNSNFDSSTFQKCVLTDICRENSSFAKALVHN